MVKVMDTELGLVLKSSELDDLKTCILKVLSEVL